MQNVILAWPSIMDGATADSLNGLGGDFPASNVLTQQLGDCFRAAASGSRIYVSLAKVEAVELFALIGTNLSPYATWSVAAGDSLESLQSGVFQWTSGLMTMPDYASLDVPGTPTLDYDFVKDSYQYGLRPRSNIHAFHIPVSAQSYRHFLFAIQDPANPEGFVQVGRVYLAKKFQPSSNMWAGMERGFEDPSVATRTRGGALRIDPYGSSRTLRFELRLASETEMRTKIYEIDAARGASGDVLCIMDADQTTYLQQDIIYGVMRDLRPIVRPELPLYTKGYQIAELPVGMAATVWDPSLDLTVVRAGTATRVGPTGYVENAAANTLRIDHDPITLQRKGLLVEFPFANALTYSEQIDHANWTKSNGTVTADESVSPGNSTTADLFVVTSTSAGGAHAKQSFTGTAASNVAVSCWFKKRDTDFASITIADGAGAGRRFWFNLNTGAVGSNSATGAGLTLVAHRIEAFPNGWYRCYATLTLGANTTVNVEFYPCVDANGSIGVTATKANRIWGAMAGATSLTETGSYMPTTNVAVTRNGDVITVSTATILDTAEITFGTEFMVPYLSAAHRHGGVLWDGTNSNRIRSGWAGGTANLSDAIEAGGATVYFQSSGVSLTANAVVKHAVRVKANDFRGCYNGTLTTASTSGAFPTGLNQIVFGARNLTPTEPVQGWLRRVTVWPRALSNSQLQTRTS